MIPFNYEESSDPRCEHYCSVFEGCADCSEERNLLRWADKSELFDHN